MSDKSNTELFDAYVSNLANHATHLAIDSGPIRLGALPGVWVEYHVEQKNDHPDIWDRCYVVEEDGERRCLGNRHAMTEHYAALCAEALRAFVENPS